MDNIIKLSILEKIEPGQKLTVYKGTITIVNHSTRIGRWISGNNRHVTLTEISNIIDTAISSNTPIDERIITSLENLKLTYHTSKNMVQSLLMLQEKIAKYMVT